MNKNSENMVFREGLAELAGLAGLARLAANPANPIQN